MDNSINIIVRQGVYKETKWCAFDVSKNYLNRQSDRKKHSRAINGEIYSEPL